MCYAHFWKRIFEKMHFEKMTCVIFVGDGNLISGRSPQVVNTKKTRSAVVISFQVVSRRDGSSKVHSRRIWYSIFRYKNLYFWGPPPGDGGDGSGGDGRIFQHCQPPSHDAQGYHIPFGSPLTPMYRAEPS